MGALCWKRSKEILTTKIKLVISLFLPILALGWLIHKNTDTIDNIFFILPVVTILLFWVVLFSIEDLIYTEAILGTGITIKNIWITNLLLTTIVGFLYSLALSIIYVLITGQLHLIFQFHFFKNSISAFIIGSGLVAFSTFYISSYSKFRQLISSVGSVGNLALLAILLLTDKVSIILDNQHILVIISAILGLLSFIIVAQYSNPEAFLCNIKKLGQVYEDKKSIDE